MMQQAQIQGFDEMAFEYRTPLFVGFSYDSSGNFSSAIAIHKNFEMIFGANDFTAQVGFGGTAQNFAPPPAVIYFTANSGTISLTGAPNATVTLLLYQLN